MEQGRLTPEKMQTSVFHFTEAEAAVKQVMAHPDAECKVTLHFARGEGARQCV
jgi:threonine dehydrogenase-like Zn-dependent dehydrogenase